jgi:hypothetical protein
VLQRSRRAPAGDFAPWVGRIVRLGYLAKGLIYSLIGLLAFRVAIGLRGGRIVDASGALRTLLRQPFGQILLVVIGAGILGYAAYYIFEAVMDVRRKGGGVRGWAERSLTILKAGVYGLVGLEALRLVFIGRRSSGDAEGAARTVMQFPFGDWFLVLVGLGVVVYGVSQLKQTWDGRFGDTFDVSRARREMPWLLPLGRFGTGARSIIIVLMGFALFLAGMQRRPSNADGFRESLISIVSQPFGPWLLGAMGAGLFCYGVFQFFHARYLRIALR